MGLKSCVVWPNGIKRELVMEDRLFFHSKFKIIPSVVCELIMVMVVHGITEREGNCVKWVLGCD